MNELLSWVNGFYELKLGLSEWNKWNRFTDENMDVQYSEIIQEIGGSLGAVPSLLPSETASEISFWEGLWEETISWI